MAKRVKEVTMIRRMIMDKLKISKQVLTNNITKLKQNCPIEITTEFATYLYAKQEKISQDILPKEKRSKLNEIIKEINELESVSQPTIIHEVTSAKKPTSTKKQSSNRKRKGALFNIQGIDFEIPCIPNSRLSDAKEMAEFYYYLYVFENSLRYQIIEIMKDKYGADWWETKIDWDPIRKYAERLKEKEKNNLMFKDEPHLIFYTLTWHLIKIIKTYWEDFEDLYGSLERIEYFCEPIKQTRNSIAHNNILSKEEKTAFINLLRKWLKDVSRSGL